MAASGPGSGTGSGSAPDAQPVAARVLGGVELREDVPLKAPGSAARRCAGGPRAISAAFGALSACITLALLAQVYCGDYEVVPHGSVSSSAAACSRAGTDALKAGGRALDAAASAALCLAVLAPHRTSLDASGSLVYWEYRDLRTKQPVLYEWGGEGAARPSRPPRLLAALAALHARLGALPWAHVVAPALRLARDGFPVSEGLSSAEAARGEARLAGTNATAPELAHFLLSIQGNTSAELAAAWDAGRELRESAPRRAAAGEWRALAGGPRAALVLRALQAALQPSPASADEVQHRVVGALQLTAGGGVASGLAVVDSHDTYAALVTGISEPFGSGEVSAAGWRRDEPSAPVDVAPAILYEPNVCGWRYVVGAESSAALAQAGAALAQARTPGAVERVRAGPGANSTAVNLVLQRGDELASHADSRGGGLASRF